jgi:hypothetical protein
MAKFMFVYRGTPGAESKMPPDQMQQVMQKWSQWIGEAMQKGWMKDPGDALTEEGRLVRGKVVSEGSCWRIFRRRSRDDRKGFRAGKRLSCPALRWIGRSATTGGTCLAALNSARFASIISESPADGRFRLPNKPTIVRTT